jgi:tetratricopeptide (TPR) repeat protein
MNIILTGLLALTLLGLTACTAAPHKVPASADATSSPQEEIMYRLLVAEIAGQRDRLDVSVANLTAVADQVNDPQVAERATRVAIYAKNYAAALNAAKRWSILAPDNIEANQVLAALALRQGDTDAAVMAFQRVLETEPESYEQGFLVIAGLLGRENDEHSKTALAVMSRLTSEYPDNAYAALAYGNLAMIFSEFAVAEQQLARAYTLKPDLHHALILRARALRELGQTDTSIGILVAAVKKHPDHTDLRLAYARTLINAKRYEEARGQFEILVERSPEDADLIYTLALLTLDMDQYEAASRYLRRLLELGKRETEAHYYLGRIAQTRREDDAAIEAYRRIVEGEYYLDAQLRIAQLLGHQGKFDEAVRHLQNLRAQSLDPAVKAQLYVSEADILGKAKKYAQATELLSKALHDMPGDTNLLYSRSLIYERLDRIDLAENDLRAVLLREPENANALNALGYTLADRTDRYQEAYSLIKQAMKLSPNNAAITDSMGWVLYRLGRHEEAIVYLRQALDLEYDAEIAAHLGEVLWVTGDYQGAQAVVKQALEKTPDDENLLKVIKQLQNGKSSNKP